MILNLGNIPLWTILVVEFIFQCLFSDVQKLNDFDPRELTAEDIVPELANMLENLMFEFGFH